MTLRILVVVGLILAGCGHDTVPAGGRDLRGRWVVDARRTRAEIDHWPRSDAMKESARIFYSDDAPRPETMHIENGTLVFINSVGSLGPVKGTWRVDSKDGERWIVIMDRDDSVKPDRMVVTWIDDDHVKVVEEGKGDVLVFAREH